MTKNLITFQRSDKEVVVCTFPQFNDFSFCALFK